METRPKIIVDLADYGMTGEIILEPLTCRRSIELKNNLGRTIHYSGSPENPRIDYQDLGDIQVYSLLAYITEAPFPIKLDSFKNFLDRADAVSFGNGERIMERIQAEVKRIKDGELSPFASSETTSTETSESS